MRIGNNLLHQFRIGRYVVYCGLPLDAVGWGRQNGANPTYFRQLLSDPSANTLVMEPHSAINAT